MIELIKVIGAILLLLLALSCYLILLDKSYGRYSVLRKLKDQKFIAVIFTFFMIQPLSVMIGLIWLRSLVSEQILIETLYCYLVFWCLQILMLAIKFAINVLKLITSNNWRTRIRKFNIIFLILTLVAFYFVPSVLFALFYSIASILMPKLGIDLSLPQSVYYSISCIYTGLPLSKELVMFKTAISHSVLFQLISVIHVYVTSIVDTAVLGVIVAKLLAEIDRTKSNLASSGRRAFLSRRFRPQAAKRPPNRRNRRTGTAPSGR